MRPTPGQLRQFAHQADRDVIHWLSRAHQSQDPDRKRYFLRCAENRQDDAEYYRDLAGRREIEVDYVDVTHFAEAAE